MGFGMATRRALTVFVGAAALLTASAAHAGGAIAVITSPDGLWSAGIDASGQVVDLFPPAQPASDNLFESLAYIASFDTLQLTERVESTYVVEEQTILEHSAQTRLVNPSSAISLQIHVTMLDGFAGGAKITLIAENKSPAGDQIGVKLFYYADYDISGTFGNDEAILIFEPNTPRLQAIEQIDSTPGDPKPLWFGGFGTYKSFEIDLFPVLRTALDTGVPQLASADFTPPGQFLDHTTALSGEKALLAPGQAVTLQVGLGGVGMGKNPCGRIDFGITPDDFDNPNACGADPIVITTQYVGGHSIVFGTAVDNFNPAPVAILNDGACHPTCRSSGMPAFTGPWWCQFRLPAGPNEPGPRAGVDKFTADLCFIDSPPGTLLMRGYDNNRNLIATAENSQPNSESLTIVAPSGQLIAYVNIGNTVRPFGVSVDCLKYRDPVERITCPWDLDGDGMVSTPDLLILLSRWGPAPGNPADFNGDGNVGTVDLLKLLAFWGLCP